MTIVPKLGFGTWRLYGDECTEAVLDALDLGYVSIDTARRYDNESAVGEAINRMSQQRDQVFLTTKLDVDCIGEEVRRQVEDSLRNLRIDYIDLLLMHWPNTEEPQAATLDPMSGLADEGLVKHIGVSNFTPSLMDEAAPYPIVANQVEFHPFLSQDGLLSSAENHDVAIVAYAPLARGKVAEESLIRQIAEGHGKTPAQVALRWCVQRPRVCAIPKTASDDRRRENMEIFDFELTPGEMQAISALAHEHRIVDPAHAPNWE